MFTIQRTFVLFKARALAALPCSINPITATELSMSGLKTTVATDKRLSRYF